MAARRRFEDITYRGRYGLRLRNDYQRGKASPDGMVNTREYFSLSLGKGFRTLWILDCISGKKLRWIFSARTVFLWSNITTTTGILRYLPLGAFQKGFSIGGHWINPECQTKVKWRNRDFSEEFGGSIFLSRMSSSTLNHGALAFVCSPVYRIERECYLACGPACPIMIESFGHSSATFEPVYPLKSPRNFFI